MLPKVLLGCLLITVLEAAMLPAPCTGNSPNSICVPRPDCKNPLSPNMCTDKGCCKKVRYEGTPPAGDCICIDSFQECGKELKPFIYTNGEADCACCECKKECTRLESELCPSGLQPIAECKENTNVYCCQKELFAADVENDGQFLVPIRCDCFNGRCPALYPEEKGKCKECCVVG